MKPETKPIAIWLILAIPYTIIAGSQLTEKLNHKQKQEDITKGEPTNQPSTTTDTQCARGYMEHAQQCEDKEKLRVGDCDTKNKYIHRNNNRGTRKPNTDKTCPLGSRKHKSNRLRDPRKHNNNSKQIEPRHGTTCSKKTRMMEFKTILRGTRHHSSDHPKISKPQTTLEPQYNLTIRCKLSTLWTICGILATICGLLASICCQLSAIHIRVSIIVTRPTEER